MTTTRKTIHRTELVIITRRDGEYRVAPSGASGLTSLQREAAAYYTDDRADALATADSMTRTLREMMRND